jgi:hypothetical protein
MRKQKPRNRLPMNEEPNSSMTRKEHEDSITYEDQNSTFKGYNILYPTNHSLPQMSGPPRTMPNNASGIWFWNRSIDRENDLSPQE